MEPTRRDLFALAAATPLSRGWDADFDRAIVAAAVQYLDGAYDPAERMIRRNVGSDYHYHTSVRGHVVHPTRDSLDYSLLLLEAGRDERACEVISRTVALQETDPQSRWYGIWGYYLEEPAPKMAPADWNWADFNGSVLLLIEFRHGARLPASLRGRVIEAIRHAAYSVRRRNVAMTYTNIAVQGTFVTLAAAELLKDDDLGRYAVDRLHRFARTVDETGSFAEYNSPTYCNVTIANLTRMRMFVKNLPVRPLVERIHERAWLHLARHWHAPSRQLAGPMSRCYQTDIGKPLWIQKALGGRLQFATADEVRNGSVRVPGEVGILQYRCPDHLARNFLELDSPREHRELFTGKVQGATWLDRSWCLGSVNRGDFWVQRRGLLAYWRGGHLQARVTKDDYDFASALLYTVQQKGKVLGMVNFRTPGGDKHPSLDPIKEGQFACRRLRLRFDITGEATARQKGGTAEIAAGPVNIRITARAARFAGRPARFSIARESGVLVVSLDWLEAPATVRWRDVPEAFAAFTLGFDSDEPAYSEAIEAGTARLHWGDLELTGSIMPAAVSAQDRAFQDRIGGRPVPFVRLSDEKLV